MLIFFADDMVEHENETLRDRVSDLEKRVHDQNDEITCLRATLADALRRINTLEAGKGKKPMLSRFFSTRSSEMSSSRSSFSRPDSPALVFLRVL